ncbi:MAG: metal ABC transporter permease [Beutenbergiaceae bacterium]
MTQLAELLAVPLFQRALLAALVVGVSAPIVGTYLVQRRLSLLGDGIGHVALTGVAMGWLVGAATNATDTDAYAIPGAMVAAIAGAVIIEIVRSRGNTSGDLALALLFYGGIAGGVMLIGLAGGTNANLMSYLFGSLATVSQADLVATMVMSVLIAAIGLGLRSALFAVSANSEFARSTGLPVAALNIGIAVVAALTVTVAMRVVGLLLVSALMIVPVAASQLLARSFRQTMSLAMVIGAVSCVGGLLITFTAPLPPGSVIVVIAITIYAGVAAFTAARNRLQASQPIDRSAGKAPITPGK